jgi:hypothetical protein
MPEACLGWLERLSANGCVRMDSTRKTWVYLAHCGNNLRKVGASVDPAKRMVLLENEHRWRFEFTLEQTWHRPHGDARAVEIAVHWYLRKAGVEQRPEIGREFFVAEAPAIAGVIEWAHLRITWP